MAQYYGFRGVQVLENVTSGDFGRNTPLVLEVTATVDTKIYVNDNPDQGFKAQGIPLKANEMRIVPLQCYWFTTDAPVTVVAYRP
jgi:hypothetical protein